MRRHWRSWQHRLTPRQSVVADRKASQSLPKTMATLLSRPKGSIISTPSGWVPKGSKRENPCQPKTICFVYLMPFSPCELALYKTIWFDVDKILLWQGVLNVSTIGLSCTVCLHKERCNEGDWQKLDSITMSIITYTVKTFSPYYRQIEDITASHALYLV